MLLLPLRKGVLPVCLLEFGEPILTVDAKVDDDWVRVSLRELAEFPQNLGLLSILAMAFPPSVLGV